MTATNHGLTGALLGAFLPLPLAIPIAFGSHFVLDSLPHYGIPHQERDHSSIYRLIVFSDVVVALSIAAATTALHKWNMEAAGWVAYSPDATWVVHYFKHGKSLSLSPNNRFMHFHRRIQRFERPWGMTVEVAVFATLFPLYLVQLLRR